MHIMSLININNDLFFIIFKNLILSYVGTNQYIKFKNINIFILKDFTPFY